MKLPKVFVALVLTATQVVFGSSPAKAETGRLPDGVTPVSYDITVAPDAAALTFTGKETITIDVTKPTATLTLNSADIDIQSVMLDGRTAGTVSTDAAAQTASFTFAETVGAGRHTLSLAYSGKIAMAASGLFAIDYKGQDGKDARMLATQFEAPDARRFAPMWDEPALKATFKLSALAPKGQTAYSNMPVVSKEDVAGAVLWHFAETPKMSTYLLFLGMGDVDRKTTMAGNVEIGVITRRGVADQGDYALANAKRLLAYYNDYFGTPYPLPKLDMIAAPGSSQFFGAMENWGAIFYFEQLLLLDPKLQTEGQKQAVFNVVAHEMAHQWFGNLVTMSWWSDLWLNEGYASWMQAKATEELNPEWKIFTQSLAEGRQAAMRQDAQHTTHPVVQEIKTVGQIEQAFDAITYLKGEAVIRMLEASVGADRFREGVRRYMTKYAYGNTVTDQLWAEISAASGRPVSPMMHSFTLQGGVPMVNVSAPRCVAGNTTLTLSQGRFALDSESRATRAWVLPVTLSQGDATESVTLEGSKPVDVQIRGCGPVVVNAGHTAYFRTRYTPAHLDALTRSFADLPLDDQVGIAADNYSLASGGYQPLNKVFAIIGATPAEASPLLWRYLVGVLTQIDDAMKGAPVQTAYRKRAAAVLKPVFDRVGWAAKPGEPSSAELLRQTIIPALGRFGDADIATTAAGYAKASLEPDSKITGAIRQPALQIWANQADDAQWALLHERAKSEAGPVARSQYYRFLGSAANPGLAEKALAIALTDEAPAPMRATLIASVAREHPKLAFEWALAHVDQVNALVDQSARSVFFARLAATSTDAAMADRVQAYAKRNLPAASRGVTLDIVSLIRYRAALRARYSGAIDAWVEAR